MNSSIIARMRHCSPGHFKTKMSKGLRSCGSAGPLHLGILGPRESSANWVPSRPQLALVQTGSRGKALEKGLSNASGHEFTFMGIHKGVVAVMFCSVNFAPGVLEASVRSDDRGSAGLCSEELTVQRSSFSESAAMPCLGFSDRCFRQLCGLELA